VISGEVYAEIDEFLGAEVSPRFLCRGGYHPPVLKRENERWVNQKTLWVLRADGIRPYKEWLVSNRILNLTQRK
jgi:hypothetical protein